jgi:HK97 family phage portal protein
LPDNSSSSTSIITDSRIRRAWDILRGRASSPDATRAVVMPSYPSLMGANGMSLVRTANPQEYKPEGATIRVKGFSGHPVVHACIRVVADIVASVPLVVLTERGNSESRVSPEHPLQRLLDYPGPRVTARQFRARYAVDYMGYGNSLFQIERRDGVGLPIGLRPINAESLQTVWVDEEGDPRRYDYGNWSGVIVQLPVEDVLHFRDLDMPKPFVPDVFGFPRGATAIASMAADNEATNYVRQVVTNDGTPTFAVLLSDEATQDDATAMQDRYKARVVDRGKRGTPAFFGSVRDIKPLGFTLSDLEFPDLRRVSREDICAAYGVDPRMVGIASATSDSGLSGAQYAEARMRLVQHTIEPMLSAIEDEINHWLAPEFGDVYVAYDVETLRDLVENDDETSKRVQAEFGASLRTWEESRRALKLPAVPVPTDSIQTTAGKQLIPAAVAVIDPTAAPLPAPATDVLPPTPGGALETEAEEPEDTADEDLIGLEDSRSAAVTNFPQKGDDRTVSLRNSRYAVFPHWEATALKADYPTIWRRGGNIRGNKQHTLLKPVAQRGGKVDGLSEERAVKLREAWAARHAGDFRLAGVVAQVKWLVVGSRGLAHMRSVLAEAKAKADGARRHGADLVRSFATDAMSGDQVEALTELLEMVMTAELPAAAVVQVILAAFPQLEADAVQEMVDACVEFAVEPRPNDEEPEDEAPEAEPDAAPLEVMAAAPWWEEMAAAGTLQDEPRYRYWKRAMDDLDAEEEDYAKAAKATFAANARSIDKLFGIYEKEAATATAARQRKMLREIDRLIATNYKEKGEYYREWKAAYERLVGNTYLAGAKQAGGVNFNFTLQSPDVLRSIDQRVSRLAELIGQDTSKQVTAAIRAGELSGFSIAETSRLVQQSVFGEQMTDVRATRIARTESASAMSGGAWDQAKELGIFQSKEWVGFTDARTSHLICMGQGRIPMDDAFSNGLMYPLDPAGDAEDVINCRCQPLFYDEPVPNT